MKHPKETVQRLEQNITESPPEHTIYDGYSVIGAKVAVSRRYLFSGYVDHLFVTHQNMDQ